MKRYALLAGFVGAVTCGAEAVTYAKLSGGTFKFYDDEACTQANASQTAVDSDTIVFFESDAEFQALKADGVKAEVAKAKDGVPYLQNDIVLTANVDWRAFDFNINGKTVTLDGWDCRVGRVQGAGTFAAGNLVTNGDFEADEKNLESWSSNASITVPPTGWTTAENSRWAVYGTGTHPQTLNKTGISYWAVMYMPNDAFPEMPTFQQSILIPRSDCEYCVSFRYMTTGFNKTNTTGKKELVPCLPENGRDSRIIVSIGDAWSVTNSCTTTDIEVFTTTLKDDNALVAGTYTLKFAIYKRNSGACFDDVEVSPFSKLYFDIPEGTDYDAGSLTLKDAGLQVHKEGEGTIVFKANNGWGMANAESLIVKGGIARQAAEAACGAQYAQITVQNGAQFDLHGVRYSYYDFNIAGEGPASATVKGALVNTEEYLKPWTQEDKTDKGVLRTLSVYDNATVGAIRQFGMVSHANQMHECKIADGKTLTYSGDGSENSRIFGGQMYYTGAGTIVIADGGDYHMASATSVPAPDCELVVYGQFGLQQNKVLSPLKSLIFKDGGQFFFSKDLGKAATTIIYKTYAPNTVAAAGSLSPHPRVQLGAEGHTTPTLDLSEWDGTFDDSAQGTLTFYDVRGESEGSTGKMKVVVDIGGRTKRIAGSRSAIYKWKDDPRAYVEFVAAPSWASKNVKMSVKSDGIYGFSGAAIILR